MNKLELIGQLAVELHTANAKRIEAKKARAIARDAHKCGRDPVCHQSKDEPELWCSNCLFVRPYHLAYKEAVIKMSVAKGKLTREIKFLIKDLEEETNGQI